MLRLDRVIKPWKESGALNAHIISLASGMRPPSLPRAAIWGWCYESLPSIMNHSTTVSGTTRSSALSRAARTAACSSDMIGSTRF
jgi:hypothetical protein